MAGYTRPELLTWDQVDPARHAIDIERVADVVRSLPSARMFPARPPEDAGDDAVLAWSQQAARWVDAVKIDLVTHYGAWASGWLYQVGGPVASPRHFWTSAEATLAGVAESLVQWRTWLVELADAFDRLLPSPQTVTAEARRQAWERAVAELVTLVVQRNDAEDAWYRHCAQVLGWFLTRAGVAQDGVAALVEEAIGGRFRSWIWPAPELIAEVAARIAVDAPGTGHE